MEVVVPQATYLVWIDCARLCERLDLGAAGALHGFFLDAGLVLSPGADFDPTGASDHCMRLNCACPRATLQDAVERLRLAIARTSKQADAINRAEAS